VNEMALDMAGTVVCCSRCRATVAGGKMYVE
jgi:hypothetical protein